MMAEHEPFAIGRNHSSANSSGGLSLDDSLCEAFSMTAALTLAAEHDLAGRHDDAINALARATQAGDLDAMTELGKRLLVGQNGPLLPKDGTALLLDAFHGGQAEAALKLATLTALGAHVE